MSYVFSQIKKRVPLKSAAHYTVSQQFGESTSDRLTQDSRSSII